MFTFSSVQKDEILAQMREFPKSGFSVCVHGNISQESTPVKAKKSTPVKAKVLVISRKHRVRYYVSAFSTSS